MGTIVLSAPQRWKGFFAATSLSEAIKGSNHIGKVVFKIRLMR